MPQTDLGEARRWLARHDLADVAPTPLLAARLAVRRRARIVDALLLAGFLIGAALIHVSGLPAEITTARLPLLLVLVALVIGLLVGQWLLGWWVRRTDRLAGARLSRRVAHPVQLGWSAVLGRPHAVFTVATFAAAFLLTLSVLRVPDVGVRYGAIVVLVGLTGAGASAVMQMRQVLASPAVADDEASLTADVVMRVEDARALTTPSLVWSLPVLFLYGESLGWWNAAAVLLAVLGAIAFALIQARTTGVGAAARRAMAIR